MQRPVGDIDELRGRWRRSLIAWPDGRQDDTTQVTWLQGIEACLDLRQPAGLPAFPRCGDLGDLSLDDCLILAQQSGFAGRFIHDDGFFTWERAIDFQPPRTDADSGALWWEDDVLIERGRFAPYIEHWHRVPLEPQTPIVALTLSSPEDGRTGALLRVGAQFMIARDRRITVTAERSLAEMVRGAIDLPAARDVVDCEISRGIIDQTGWRIIASTLPFLADRRLSLALHDRRVALTVTGYKPRLWDIAAIEGDPGALS